MRSLVIATQHMSMTIYLYLLLHLAVPLCEHIWENLAGSRSINESNWSIIERCERLSTVIWSHWMYENISAPLDTQAVEKTLLSSTTIIERCLLHCPGWSPVYTIMNVADKSNRNVDKWYDLYSVLRDAFAGGSLPPPSSPSSCCCCCCCCGCWWW